MTHFTLKNKYANSLNPICRIAFVGNTSFSLYKFRLGVMRSFILEGFDVIAIAPKDEYSKLFSTENIKFIPVEIDGKGKDVFEDFKLICKFINIYKKYELDFIFHYTIKPNIYGSIACRFLKIPSIAITTGLGFSFNNKSLFNLFIKTLYRFSLRKVLEVWFLNTNDKEIFIRNGIIKNRKAYILPSEGIDSNYYLPKEKTTHSDKFVFLLLSRLIKEKGIEEYVKAAVILQQRGLNVECQLLGKQEKESSKCISIDSVMEWHNTGKINYLGEFIDIREYIVNSDCIVLPSYYMEGVPRCLMEGMSMERPIITTDNVGCRELILDEINGFICEPMNVIDLADKMEKLYNTSINERKTMGINGRKHILEYFDEPKIIEQYHIKLNSFFPNSYAKRFDSIVPDQSNRSIVIGRNIEKIKRSI